MEETKKKVKEIIYRWLSEEGKVEKELHFFPWERNPRFAYQRERSEDFMKLVDGKWGYCYTKDSAPVYDGSSFVKKDGVKITRQIQVITEETKTEETKEVKKDDEQIIAEAIVWFVSGGDIVLASRSNFHGLRKHLNQHQFWMLGFGGTIEYDALAKEWLFKTSDGRYIRNNEKIEIGNIQGFLSFTVCEGQDLRIKVQKV